METDQLALVLAILALAIAASGHSPVALVIAIIALVLSFSDYKEVGLVLAVTAIALAVLLSGTGWIIH